LVVIKKGWLVRGPAFLFQSRSGQ